MTISNTLIEWYNIHSRELPWRKTTDPYAIWISEIILQQTRIEQGLPYYYRFMEAFPNVGTLSQASEDQVLKLWQGLGYYSRARNMMVAAQQIMNNHKGVFPHKFEEIIKLKGIGNYTAAAIASFSFQLPHAVLDGNVFRVLARYFGISTPINSSEGKKYFEKIAQEILDPKNPAIHNQAIMEFGALHCKPQNPNCLKCPLADSCFAFTHNIINDLPVKLKTLKIKNRFLNYFLLSDGKNLLIEKRDHGNIWKGLYQLPLIETDEDKSAEDILEKDELLSWIDNQAFDIIQIQEIQHKLTHRVLHIRFFHLKITHLSNSLYNKVSFLDLDSLAFPKPIHSFLEGIRKS